MKLKVMRLGVNECEMGIVVKVDGLWYIHGGNKGGSVSTFQGEWPG